MRAIFLSMIAFLVCAMAGAFAASEPDSYQDHMTKVGEAFDTEDWSGLNQHLDAAQAIRPYSLYVRKSRKSPKKAATAQPSLRLWSKGLSPAAQT